MSLYSIAAEAAPVAHNQGIGFLNEHGDVVGVSVLAGGLAVVGISAAVKHIHEKRVEGRAKVTELNAGMSEIQSLSDIPNIIDMTPILKAVFNSPPDAA